MSEHNITLPDVEPGDSGKPSAAREWRRLQRRITVALYRAYVRPVERLVDWLTDRQ